MKNRIIIPWIIAVILGWTFCYQAAASSMGVSGDVLRGYRVLAVTRTDKPVALRVYRGDYIKFRFDKSVGAPILSIPAMSIQQKLPARFGQAPYFKMKTTGTVDFTLGNVVGTITVVEYRQPRYRLVDSRDAAELIRTVKPLVLDVRTPREFKAGHLENARLIPVQELQTRLKELSPFKDDDIFIYCATGNRSTVASKILIDNGFQRIINLRGGIRQWSKNQYPVTR